MTSYIGDAVGSYRSKKKIPNPGALDPATAAPARPPAVPPKPGALFTLHQPFPPAGDQPRAIRELVEGLARGDEAQVLLGITGSGKTFSIANVIAEVSRPTLIIAHNKVLAAQLYGAKRSSICWRACAARFRSVCPKRCWSG